MTKLVVIAGPANSGKMPLARKLAAENPEYKIVHRDDLRAMFVNEVSEDQITWNMRGIASDLLSHGHTPLIVAWNLEPSDRRMWEGLAAGRMAELVWLDVREPEVAALIPPMPAPSPPVALVDAEDAAQVAYRICAETRHVTLGDRAAAAIRALVKTP